MVKAVEIAGRRVGPGAPCLIVAEAGVNHNGDLTLARRLVDVAVEARADAVKFQTFEAERLVGPTAPKAAYQRENGRDDESQLQMLKRLELPAAAYAELFDYCRARGILFLSTPFDERSADVLEGLGVAAYKVASGEVTNVPLLRHVAAKRKPVILSTGMSTLEDVKGAVAALRDVGTRDLVLLHCVSCYPARAADANLRAMHTLEAEFGVPVGYSDHTLGLDVALAAVALGAAVIEKHFTVDRALPGPDHRASLEPGELQALVRGIRTVESALGHGRKEPVPGEAAVAVVARKSLVAARDIPAGTRLTPDLVAVRRPGTGLPPTMLSSVLGRALTKPVRAGELLTAEMLA
jgi:N-acetylneuraminate synthase